MSDFRSWIGEHRKGLGLTLMLSGVIPWVCLMGYIVHVRFPSGWLIAATVICWAVFFVGKTLFREPSYRGEQHRESY